MQQDREKVLAAIRGLYLAQDTPTQRVINRVEKVVDTYLVKVTPIPVNAWRFQP